MPGGTLSPAQLGVFHIAQTNLASGESANIIWQGRERSLYPLQTTAGSTYLPEEDGK